MSLINKQMNCFQFSPVPFRRKPLERLQAQSPGTSMRKRSAPVETQTLDFYRHCNGMQEPPHFHKTCNCAHLWDTWANQIPARSCRTRRETQFVWLELPPAAPGCHSGSIREIHFRNSTKLRGENKQGVMFTISCRMFHAHLDNGVTRRAQERVVDHEGSQGHTADEEREHKQDLQAYHITIQGWYD